MCCGKIGFRNKDLVESPKCVHLKWLHRDGVKGLLTSAERGATPVLQRLQALAMLLLAFLIGIRFLKGHKGFIPFYVPRELSIAMKEM